MSSNKLIDVTDVKFVHREKASYEQSIVKVDFKTEEEFLFWKPNVADKHATWTSSQTNKSVKTNAMDEELLRLGRFFIRSVEYRCDHSGVPRVHKKETNNVTEVGENLC